MSLSQTGSSLSPMRVPSSPRSEAATPVIDKDGGFRKPDIQDKKRQVSSAGASYFLRPSSSALSPMQDRSIAPSNTPSPPVSRQETVDAPSAIPADTATTKGGKLSPSVRRAAQTMTDEEFSGFVQELRSRWQ